MIDRARKSGQPYKLQGGIFTGPAAVVDAAGPIPLKHSVVQFRAPAGGATAVTLADSPTQGFILALTITTVAGGDSVVVTPENLAGYTTITFDALGETATLIFVGTAWQVLAVTGATLA